MTRSEFNAQLKKGGVAELTFTSGSANLGSP